MDIKTLREWTRGLHVLYVEDEKEIQEETRDFLEQLMGKVVTASNGKDGLDAFNKEPFDLVITDLKMPKMGGEEMIRSIKENAPRTVVVAMSGLSGADGQGGLDSDFFIRKPASTEDFIELLARIYDRGMISK